MLYVCCMCLQGRKISAIICCMSNTGGIFPIFVILSSAKTATIEELGPGGGSPMRY